MSSRLKIINPACIEYVSYEALNLSLFVAQFIVFGYIRTIKSLFHHRYIDVLYNPDSLRMHLDDISISIDNFFSLRPLKNSDQKPFNLKSESCVYFFALLLKGRYFLLSERFNFCDNPVGRFFVSFFRQLRTRDQRRRNFYDLSRIPILSVFSLDWSLVSLCQNWKTGRIKKRFFPSFSGHGRWSWVWARCIHIVSLTLGSLNGFLPRWRVVKAMAGPSVQTARSRFNAPL